MNRILKLPEVKATVGLSTTRIYQGMRDGTFPASRRLGPGSVGWLASDIEAWMEALPVADPNDELRAPAVRARAARLRSVD